MFRTVLLSKIRSFSLHTQQWCMSYRFADSFLASCQHDLYVLLCVQWKTPDDGQRKCPKHVEFYSKNKFEKLLHLVGFVIRFFNTMHGHLNGILKLLLLLLLLLYKMAVFCHRPFPPGTSLEPAVIPTAQDSSFTLQYFPYYVWCSKYSCLL